MFRWLSRLLKQPDLRLHLRANFLESQEDYLLACEQARKLMKRDRPADLIDLPDGRVISAEQAYERWHLDRL